MRPTILIVDDHEAVRRSLREWLQVSLPGCHLLSATSAEDALTMAKDEAPTLVLMDVRLPGMDGLEATRQLRARHPRMPIVILTLYDDLPTRARATTVGASAFVSKQTMYADLLAALEAFLPRQATREGAR